MLFPGSGGDGGEQSQCDQSLSRRRASSRQVRLCSSIPPYSGARVYEPTARPDLSAAAAE